MYKKVYLMLFNRISDVIEEMEEGDREEGRVVLCQMLEELKGAQCAAEEMILSDDGEIE